MVFFLIRPHSWRLDQCHKVLEENYLQNVKKQQKKNVERAFGVLKSRFAIICGPSRTWNMDTMIVKDEWDTFIDDVNVDYDYIDNDISNVEISRDVPSDFATNLQTRRIMHIRRIHQQLQTDMVSIITIIMKFNFSLTLMYCIFLLSNLCIFHLFNI